MILQCQQQRTKSNILNILPDWPHGFISHTWQFPTWWTIRKSKNTLINCTCARRSFRFQSFHTSTTIILIVGKNKKIKRTLTICIRIQSRLLIPSDVILTMIYFKAIEVVRNCIALSSATRGCVQAQLSAMQNNSHHLSATLRKSARTASSDEHGHPHAVSLHGWADVKMIDMRGDC